jgi:hypothetical protein
MQEAFGVAFVACIKVFAAQAELFDEAPWNANGGTSAFLHGLLNGGCECRVVLRLPMDKIRTGADGVLVVSSVRYPHQRPKAIVVLEKARIGHLLLGAPSTEIAIDKGSSMSKNLPMDAVAAVFKGKSTPVNIGLQPTFRYVICKGKGRE